MVREIADEVMEVAHLTVQDALNDDFSKVYPVRMGNNRERVWTPSRYEMVAYLSVMPGEVSHDITSSGLLDEMDYRRGARPRREPAWKVLTPADIIELWEWDGGILLSKNVNSGALLVSRSGFDQILTSSWRVDKPLDLRELTAVRDIFAQNFLWSDFTVGEWAFAVARSRLLWGMTHDVRRQKSSVERHVRAEFYRKTARTFESLAWSIIHEATHKSDDSKMFNFAGRFGFDEVESYVLAGYDDFDDITNLIEHGIDAEAAAALRGGAV